MQLFNIEDASYQELRVVQEKLLELLKFYDSFCKKHNLKYWLAGGSMIGAIREGELFHGMMILMFLCQGKIIKNL